MIDEGVAKQNLAALCQRTTSCSLIPVSKIDVWSVSPHRIVERQVLARQFGVLSEQERQRYRRFVYPRHRHQYLVSHALVRDVLSRYAPVSPEAWRFGTSPHGRPTILEPMEWRALKFNLSHTDGLSAVAVAWELAVGVDVEAVRMRADLRTLAERIFSAPEVEQLKVYPDRFFDLWTLKEAYVKATGFGLAIPLNRFSIVLSELERPRILFHASCPGRPEAWQFVLRRRKKYRMGLAAEVGALTQLSVKNRTIVPLA